MRGRFENKMYFIKHVSRVSALSFVTNVVQAKFYSSLAVSSRATTRLVLVSRSNSIYDNLALEEWMYENTDFSDTDYLLMWRNRPAVVFGRHQNPWLEANIPLAYMDNVDIARRSSGGGTVYHDEGNLNLSFLKSRNRYNRKENLHLVVDSIKSKWNLDLEVNARDDIVLDQFYKVSGTAAKLGRVQSYHHFTLLLAVDTSQLWKLLDSPMQGVNSRATKSVPASIKNLEEKIPDLKYEILVDLIGHRFLQEVGAQTSPTHLRYVDPLNETEFPGVLDIRKRLQSWDWIYGKTPKFSLCRTFTGHDFEGVICTLKVNIEIEKGNVVLMTVHLDHQKLVDLIAMINKFYCEIVGNLKLNRKCLSDLERSSREHFKTIISIDRLEVMSVVEWVIRSVDLCYRFV
uniref:BPL/LPL catalytic domain-containing protein n=1 Tax=Arion vulgaris TaxID=1028688 RepID=A0A0B6ZNP8_9EUPU